MSDRRSSTRAGGLAWTAADLHRALLRRAHFQRAARRQRRTGGVPLHAGVSRRAIRQIGRRAAASLVRHGDRDLARELLIGLSHDPYHDANMLALEILDRLVNVWLVWSFEMTRQLSQGLRHPWAADRLALVQGRLLRRNPTWLSKHAVWAASQNPLRRRAAALALLPHCRRRPTSKGVPVARAVPILRLLLIDPEPHPWTQQALGHALVHYATRAPRTIARLLAGCAGDIHAPHLLRTRVLLESLAPAS